MNYWKNIKHYQQKSSFLSDRICLSFNTTKYKNRRSEDFISWEPKVVYDFKFIALNNDFPPSIKYFNKQIGL